MYVVVNISPGADMSYVMATLAERALTFSVTDDLSKICVRCNGKSSQPLPVPHQLESPPVVNHKTEPRPVSRETPHPVSREPQQAGPSGLPILKFRMPSGAVVHQMPKMVTKKIEIRKRGTEEEMSLTSESDPLILDEDHPMAQNALSQLSGVLLQPPSTARIVNVEPPQMKKVKEEEELTEDKVRFGVNSTLSPANAAAIVSDLFKESPSSSSHAAHDDYSPYSSSRAAREFRGECRLCQLPISTRTHHMRRHAMKHLGYKTYLCQLCEKEFNRSDLCKSHFERYHPQQQIVPFRDIITPEQQIKLDQMLSICFPEEHKNRA